MLVSPVCRFTFARRIPVFRLLVATYLPPLRPLPGRYPGVIEEVRGAGLLLGLKCVVPNADLQTELRESQQMLAVGAADNVLRLLPPLTIEAQHVTEAVDKIEAACARLARHAA